MTDAAAPPSESMAWCESLETLRMTTQATLSGAGNGRQGFRSLPCQRDTQEKKSQGLDHEGAKPCPPGTSTHSVTGCFRRIFSKTSGRQGRKARNRL